jgi:hypothetical protein
MFVHGLDPIPTNFADVGTIPNLTETFLFWRISKGGPGLPDEGGPWESAMPVWEKFLTEDEIWNAILFLYDYTGRKPRAKEEMEAQVRRSLFARPARRGPRLRCRAPDLGSDADRQREAIYDKYCSQCHGDAGDGNGSAAVHLMPARATSRPASTRSARPRTARSRRPRT